MKKLLIILVVLSTSAFAQIKNADSTITKNELIKIYESEKESLQKVIKGRVIKLLLEDPIAQKRADLLTKDDTIYNQLVGSFNNYEILIKRIKTDDKKELKQ